jgi:hypothetical protein
VLREQDVPVRVLEIVRGFFVGGASADPDLWGICGEATARETVVPDAPGRVTMGLLPARPPPHAGRLRLAGQPCETLSWHGHHGS